MLRKFIHYYKPYMFVFVLDLICASFISLVDLAYPQVLRSFGSTIYNGTREEIMHAVPLILAIGLLCYLLQTACKYYVTYQGHIMGAQMERDMRRELFHSYESLSFSYYDRNNTGQLMSRVVSDLFDIAELAHHGPENLFISAIKLIGSFVFLFIIQWRLALILMVIVIAMIIFSVLQNKKMQATFLDNRRRIGDINSTLQDSLSGIRIVQAFANEDVEQRKFEKGNEAFLKSKKINYRVMGMFQSGNLLFTGLLYLTVLVCGGIFIAEGYMTAADLMMYALYIGIFISPIQVLVELLETMQKGMSGFRRFLEIVEQTPEVVDAPDAEDIRDPYGDIVYEDVSFSYGNASGASGKKSKEANKNKSKGSGKKTSGTDGKSGNSMDPADGKSKDPSDGSEAVLSHVNFTIKAGKSVALVGPSGGGKTTICNILPRFYNVNGGRVTIGGQDISKIKLESLRNAIGTVQQDVYLFGGTILENIAYGNPDASMDEIIAAAKRANIHDFIMSLPDGYGTIVGERGTRLSGGQKQRVSIARVFLKNPPILILDEATSALDNESERFIQKSLDELAKDRTTITIAHRLSTIKNADEILVIDDQGIVERGSHDELMALGGTYAKYYNMQ